MPSTVATAVTVDEFVERLGFGAYQWRLLLITGLAWASDAGETMLLSFLGPAAVCAWPGTSSGIESSLTTVVFVGMAIGTVAFGRIADWYGRKVAVLASSMATVVAGAASALSPDVAWLLLFRMLTGFGIGGVPIAFSMYLEVVPTKHRGFWAAVIQMWWSVGTMSVAALAWWLLQSPGWRAVVGIASVPLAVLCIFYACFVVESPRYLVERGRLAEAQATLQRIARINGCSLEVQNLRLIGVDAAMAGAKSPLLPSPAPAAADAASAGASPAAAHPTRAGARGQSSYGTLEDVTEGADADPSDGGASPGGSPGQEAKPGTAETTSSSSVAKSGQREGCMSSMCGMITGTCAILQELVSPSMIRTTLLIWVLWLANALAYYGIVLLSTEVRVAGNSETCANGEVFLSNEDFTSIFIDSAAELPGLAMAAVLADLIGRRWSQAVGLIVASGACLALIFTPSDLQAVETGILFVARAFILCAFTVTYLFTPEVYPQHMRATGLGVANMFGRVGGGIAPFIGQGLVKGGQLRLAEGVFSGVAAVAAAASLLIRVETAGKSLGATGAVDAPSKAELDLDQAPDRSPMLGADGDMARLEDEDGVSVAGLSLAPVADPSGGGAEAEDSAP
ncbi:hypothetical protein FNF31_00251 [Cafeteria roenbergensis]|uniref:Major facilitator superfamily (MFS) profile domain-containing protein n=1 Tax=Cafeteria roenbergensis TaxID=33653 RepID=A0A5A8DZH2_CAFRO|nr:hypothetical protein FNF31_00251 [Cafeteria roenbergensis]